MGRLALAIAYDGTRFESFARQPGRRTVEGEVLRVLEEARVLSDARAARFRAASRTDAGVSAAFNVVAFDCEAAAGAVAALGTRAPEGLHFLGAQSVEATFEPRHASRRTYRYFLARPWPWSRVAGLARAFQGEHDLTNFRRADAGKPPWARIERIRYLPRLAAVEITAPFFLWQQVRRIISALDGVVQSRWPAQRVRDALLHPDRRVDLGVAPAENLVLWDVRHPGLRFEAPPASVRARVTRDLEARRRGLRWLETVATRLRPGPARR